MSKLRLTQFSPTERPAWHVEPLVENSFSVQPPCRAFVVAGPMTEARDAATLVWLDELVRRNERVTCVYVSGSPDESSHLLSRNGSPLLPQADAMLARGAAEVLWLQVAESVDTETLMRAFAVMPSGTSLLVEGNLPMRCFEPIRSVFVQGDGLRTRADLASRRVRELADLDACDLSSGLVRALMQEVFT